MVQGYSTRGGRVEPGERQALFLKRYGIRGFPVPEVVTCSSGRVGIQETPFYRTEGIARRSRLDQMMQEMGKSRMMQSPPSS